MDEPNGVAVAPNGNLFVADRTNGRVLMKSGSTGTVTSVAVGGLSAPKQVATDAANNLYIVDQDANNTNGVVVKLATAASGYATVTTIVGQGDARSASFDSAAAGVSAQYSFSNQVNGIAVDSSGDIYIADAAQALVFKANLTAGTIAVVAGKTTGGAVAPSAVDQPALTVNLNSAYALALAPSGDLYIGTNAFAEKVLRLHNGNVKQVVASAGAVNGVVVDPSGILYYASITSGQGAVYSLDTTASSPSPVLFAGGGASIPTSTASPLSASTNIPAPLGLAMDAGGTLYVSNDGDRPNSSRTPQSVFAIAPAQAPQISSAAPTAATTGVVFSYSYTSLGKPAPTYAVSTGALPTGLSLNASTGAVTGTPTTAGSYSFTVTATNASGSDPQSASVVVAAAPSSGGGSGGAGGSVPALLAQTVQVSGPGTVSIASGTARVAAVASAGGDLTYTSSDPAVASVDGSGVLTLRSAGTTTVTARAAATATHGSASASTTVVVTPAPKTTLPAGVSRLAGADRVATSVAVSREVFADPEAGKSANVVIATSAKFADSIAGTRLAGQVQGPLLLTGTDELDGQVADEVRRLVRKGGTVYILGQEKALSATVKNALASLSSDYPIERVGGADRYDTAAAIADEVTSQTGDVGPLYVVTGTDFADGVSVGAYAQRTGGVVLLTDGDKLPSVTATYLRDHDPAGTRTVPVGGAAASAVSAGGFAAAASKAVVGDDRYETSALLAGKYAELKTAANSSGKVTSVGIAGGASWPDALAGSAAMSHLDGPLLLTPTGAEALAGSTAHALQSLSAGADRAVVFGGDRAVSDQALAQVKGLLEG